MVSSSKFICLLTCFLLLSGFLSAQQREVLTAEAFIEQVRQFHPVAKQADLIVKSADANLLSARGNFDPLVQMEADRKTFDGINYYNYNNPELKIPLPLNFEIKSGIENTGGQYSNPELTKGTASYLGLEARLVNGLLIDKRRAVLRQAKLYRSQSEEEKAKVLNDLLFEAYTSYWQWSAAYKMYRIYSNYLDAAQRRMRLVNLTYQNGDRAVADTVEAYTQLLNFRLLQNEALLELSNRQIDLSAHLWDKNQSPYLLAEIYVPDTSHFNSLESSQAVIEQRVDQLASSHPEANIYRYKLKVLDVERRLKFQNLLPVFNIRANVLSKDYYTYKGFDAAYWQNNYKLGFTIKMPLFLRDARGEYQNIRFKIRETDLMLNQKVWELQNKVRQYGNEVVLLTRQLESAREMHRSYVFLLKTEELKFAQGESSLFLINSRETKILEIEQKIVQLQLKRAKAVYAIEWASGSLR